ncbi:MAG: hypothetical protein ACKVTZ_18830 [Bacteroidia bacterium]
MMKYEVLGIFFTLFSIHFGLAQPIRCYKDILFCTNKLPSFQKVKLSQNELTLKHNKLIIIVTKEPFSSQKHKIEKKGGYIFRIDGNKVFGIDGEIPQNQYKSIKIRKNNQDITIPSWALSNLFEPNLELMTACCDAKQDKIYIFAENSSGAVSYNVVWIIEKGKYVGKYTEIYNP